MEKFAQHQKLFLTLSLKKLGPVEVIGLGQNKVYFKPNKYNLRFVDLDSMSLDDKRDVEYISIYGQVEPHLKTIHIPSLHPQSTETSVANSIGQMGFGKVERVDIVTNPTNGRKKGFVHFSNTTTEFYKLYNYLWSRKDAQVKIHYNYSNYWYFRRVDNRFSNIHSKPFIVEFDEESDSESDDEE
jgi:hypothetical protein